MEMGRKKLKKEQKQKKMVQKWRNKRKKLKK